MACPGSFPSSGGEKHPDPKSSWEVDLVKPGCTTSCHEDKTEDFLCAIICILVPDSQLLQPNLDS